MSLEIFHPALRRWFEQKLGRPTDAQARAWPAIRSGRHTLIAAPTGSGKTLAAFYSAINELVTLGLSGPLPAETRVVYVSPLKALSNDIHANLEIPLEGIREALREDGLKPVKITVAVRTGDTTAGERQKMLKTPPHILVTTPESLYLLLTSESGRRMLRPARTVIIDEIHALVGDKRGSHLALSLERLEALAGRPLQRIGLSATQKPVELIARFLTGSPGPGSSAPDCVIVDTGLRRELDIRIEVPKSPLTAVMANEVWGELYERLIELVRGHRTTLVFVNTRRLAERLARGLAERIGEEHVSSHHGSMSKEHRHRAEKRLKAGELKVLVATASMELGIDIGSVELVVQFSSPKRISAFLQRVGRSRHYVGGTPKGILFPLTRDDLVECAAIFDSIRRGELDAIHMPEEPLDILSQQIVAEAAGREWEAAGLYECFRRAYPYRNLSRGKFTEIVRMLADGFTTRRGRRGAYLHYDAIHGRIRARRGARLAALTNGGSIPDMFDYDVILQPEGIKVGTLNEDFALESLAGDIFTLGTHSWQLLRIEGLKVMVQDAAGKPPSVPFWLGESFARSNELSEAVSRLRETVGAMLDAEPLAPCDVSATAGPTFAAANHRAARWLVEDVGMSPEAAEQIVIYLWMGKTGLGVMPAQDTIVMERFFDEAGDTHLVLHSPYGSRVNRGWGLALRKKFCRVFNFELQAAADENSIILSLSSSHSFPLEDVFRYVTRKILGETLVQAVLATPFFEIRWRWNATRSLAILRNRSGKRVPPHFQRMQAEDLIAQVFPGQIACAENIQGDIEIPDHPLVDQVLRDCLTEAVDIDTLERLMERIERGEVKLVARDLREPSVFAQEIINARPYAFLDDTEFAQRRVNAIKSRGWLDPGEARELSRLDPEAIEGVRKEAWPRPESADELHDTLMVHAFVTDAEGEANAWTGYFEQLIAQGRAARVRVRDGLSLWIAAERWPLFQAVYPGAEPAPRLRLPPELSETWTPDRALVEIVRGRLEALGPVTAARLAADLCANESEITQALVSLENEGFVFRGEFESGPVADPVFPGQSLQWCERRLLARIHKYTIESLRQSIQPVSVQDYIRFLFEHHGLAGELPTGPAALQRVLEQLEGFEAPAAAWETDLLPSRVGQYDPAWLDVLCLSGKIVWGRFDGGGRAADSADRLSRPKSDRFGVGPVKSTPISLVSRQHLELWRRPVPEDREKELSAAAGKVRLHLKTNGASFFEEIAARTGLLHTQTETAIAELVSNGWVSSDSYTGLRALLTPQANRPSASPSRQRRKRQALFGIEHAGRWFLLEHFSANAVQPPEEVLERLVLIYMKRWGVVFRSVMEKETFAPPWRILIRVLRRLELRGDVRGGRFVSQVSGEQFAFPETVDRLRKIRGTAPDAAMISISAADPLNLLGGVLPGRRVARLAGNRILFRGGLPVAAREGGEIEYLRDFPPAEQWEVQKALVQGKFPPKLRYYLGKNYG